MCIEISIQVVSGKRAYSASIDDMVKIRPGGISDDYWPREWGGIRSRNVLEAAGCVIGSADGGHRNIVLEAGSE